MAELKHGATEDWGYVQAHVSDEEFTMIMREEYGQTVTDQMLIWRGYARWVPATHWVEADNRDYAHLAILTPEPCRGAFPITYCWWDCW